MLLSFLAPGAGHLYLGRAGPAFTLGLIAVVAFPLWIVIWAKTQFGAVTFLFGLMFIETVRRVGSAVWAGLIARKHPSAVLLRWQRPLAYGTFVMLFFLTDGNFQGYVFRNLATPIGVPSNAEAPLVKQHDSVWLLRTGPAATPRRGALVVFRRMAPEQNSAVFVLEGPQVIGRVIALSGDEVEVTAEAVTVNGQPVGNSAGGTPFEKAKLREGQVFVLASQHVGDLVRDSRDLGPLIVGDYVGEIAIVQSAESSLFGRIADAKDTLLK